MLLLANFEKYFRKLYLVTKVVNKMFEKFLKQNTFLNIENLKKMNLILEEKIHPISFLKFPKIQKIISRICSVSGPITPQFRNMELFSGFQGIREKYSKEMMRTCTEMFS